MVIKKRQLLAATLVLALGSAVFVNWYYTRPVSKAVSAVPETSAAKAVKKDSELGEARYVLSTDVAMPEQSNAYFEEAKEKRNTAHDSAAQTLQKVITDASSPARAVREATDKLNYLSQTVESEAKLENLIKAKLGCDCLAAIDSSAVQIVVCKSGLDATSALQIKELAANMTGLGGEKVTIIEFNG